MMSVTSLTPRKATDAVSYRTSETGAEATTLTLNGIEIPLRETKETLFEEISTLYKKGDRKDLDKKDRLALIAAATEKKESTYFTPLALTIDDESKLDDCYNIGTKIEKVEARHRLYDMHDVFTVVVPEADGKTLKAQAYNLYAEYASVTADMVAASNKWYNSWPAGDTWQENLNWTHQFFELNVAQELAEKINEVYMGYPRESRGGPLYFVLLMNQLLSQTEEAVLALQSRLKKLDLKNIPGENVDKAISLARAAIIRLETFNKTPEDLVRSLLKTFQTTSVPSFNEIFKHMEKQRLLTQALGGTVRKEDELTATGIFRVASSQYRLLWEEGSWTGVRTKGEAIFNASGKTGICWNCGQHGHILPDCKLPRDEKKIAANRDAQRKAVREAKGNKGTSKGSEKAPKPNDKAPGTGKWKAPTPEEHNRRVIDGKPMWYNRKIRRWVPDTKTPGGNTATPSTPAPAASTAPTTNGILPAPTQQVPSPRDPVTLAAYRNAYASIYANALQQLGSA
jgi:Zinc knuckle